MNKIKLLFIAIAITGVNLATAQSDDELKALALSDAKATAKAMLDSDFETIAKYTHPNIAAVVGGKDKMVAMLEQSFGGMKEAGISVDESSVGKLISFKKEDGEYHCLIENYLVMTMQLQKKRVSKKSTLFGFYHPEEKQWTFVEANKLGEGSSQFFPDFKTSIEIPDDQQTVEDL